MHACMKMDTLRRVTINNGVTSGFEEKGGCIYKYEYIYNIDKLWMKVMCNEEHMVTMNASVYIWNVSNGGLILE